MKDVNDRTPVFEKQTYLSSVPEIAPIGTPIEDVQATDADFGPNAEITYRISKGAYDDFAINALTGQITLNGELDYDRRDSYSIEVIAVDTLDEVMEHALLIGEMKTSLVERLSAVIDRLTPEVSPNSQLS